MNSTPAPPPVPHHDRSVWCVVTGVFVILLGLICSVLALTIVASALLLDSTQSPGVSISQILPGMIVYAALAAGFLILGVGMIRKRKWARDLLFAFSWIWLYGGTIGFVGFLLVIGGVRDELSALPNSEAVPPGLLDVILAITAVMMAVIYILLPGVLAFVLGRKGIVATIRSHHTAPGWTDRLSTPVHILVLLLFAGGLSFLGSFAYRPVLPFFGTFLVGTPAGILIVLICVLWIVLGFGAARLRLWAWWGTCASMGIFWISALITFSMRNLMDLYRAMQFPADQLAEFEKLGIFDSPWLAVLMFVGFIPLLILLIAVKKDFLPARSASELPHTPGGAG